MGSIFESISKLFSSNTVRVVPFYSLKDKIFSWQETGNYPSYYELPAGISFPSEFWSRIADIQRYTREDGFERAISVWWADGEFVVADYVRGEKFRVVIPKQDIQVAYNPAGTNRFEKVVTISGKVYSKRTVQATDVQGKKKIEVNYLFNMHTHPPRDGTYSLFSGTDVRGLLSSKSMISGLVTDRLWLIMKTNAVQPAASTAATLSGEIGVNMLTKELGLKVYAGEFGRSLVAVQPDALPVS